MTRILLIGKNGQIGWELFRKLQPIALIVATQRSELDVTNKQEVFRILKTIKPDIVINATGYNNVDEAERDKDIAISINVTANELLAVASYQVNAFYLSYSSDYVFDGQKKAPYTETDQPNPLSVYGKSKLDGEIAIVNSRSNFIIFRTSSVFSLRRPCFLTNFLKKTQQGASIQVRSDLVSSPTSAKYLAETTAQIISMGISNSIDWLSERQGIYHLASTGTASRFEWAKEICDILNLSVDITPTVGSDYVEAANRPKYSVLDSSKLHKTFQLPPMSWKKMLRTTLPELL